MRRAQSLTAFGAGPNSKEGRLTDAAQGGSSVPTWDEITRLANRYDCLALAGSLPAAMHLADRVRAERGWSGCLRGSARELQACLSFECRAWQHCQQEPDGEDLQLIQELYEAVKAQAV